MLVDDEYVVTISKTTNLLHPLTTYEKVVARMSQFTAQEAVYKLFMNKYFRPTPPKRPDIFLTAQQLFPGKIFTFMYDPLYKDKLDFYDTRPIAMSIKSEVCIKTGNQIETCINLNLLPREIRIIVIASLWNVYEKLIRENQKKIDKKQVSQQRPLFIDGYDYMKVVDSILEYINKTSYKFAIRSYIFPRIQMPKEISYNDWGLIPFISTKDVEGESLEFIFKSYWAFKLQQAVEIPSGPKRKKNKPIRK